MKARLNLTIEQNLLKQIKDYAESRQKSISELVEEYFKSIPKGSKRASFVDKISQLQRPDIPDNVDFKKEYFEAKGKKYGL